MNKITIIIPIYNLSENRLVNFLFILRKLEKTLDTCDVIVSEQVSKKSDLKSLLKIYPKIQHLQFDIGDVFNKSILINRVAEHINTEFIWIVDSDFYTNFEEVLTGLEEFTDFVRPFDELVILNKQETQNLVETNYVKIERNTYDTSSANGKYSFIVKTDIFKTSGMMNENYVGWGFQDLDFVENRLQSKNISSLTCMAFHLWHPIASKKYVNQNKLLYQGLAHQTQKKSNYLDCSNNTDVIDNIVTERTINPIKIKKKISNIRPKTLHIHVSYNNVDIFRQINNTQIIKVSKKIKKIENTPSGTTKVNILENNFVYYYIKYIIDNYDSLEGSLCFTNDFFHKNTLLFSGITQNKLKSEIEKNISSNFKWLFTLSKLPKNIKMNKKYFDCNFTKHESYCSSVGFFKIKSEFVKKLPLDSYESIFEKLKNWSDLECEYFFANFKSFIDIESKKL